MQQIQHQKSKIERIMPMQNENSSSTAANNTFSRKIGRATYIVHVFFSESAKESFSDKILRLIKNDIANEAKEHSRL